MWRRKLIVAIAASFCVGGFVSWRMWHECDPRLAGRWLVTYSQPATAEQLREVSGRVTGLARANWTLRQDGSGEEHLSYSLTTLLVPAPADGTIDQRIVALPRPILQSCRWWTEGDRLMMDWDWGPAATGWRRLQAVVFNLFRGTVRSSRVEEYTYRVEEPGVIRLESHAEGEQVYYMTRIEDE